MTVESIIREEEFSKKMGFHLGSTDTDNYSFLWVIPISGDITCQLEIRNYKSKETTVVSLDAVSVGLPYNIVSSLGHIEKELEKKCGKQVTDFFFYPRMESWFDGFNHLEEVLLRKGVDADLLDEALHEVVREGRKRIIV